MKQSLLTCLVFCIFLSCKKNCPEEIDLLKSEVEWLTFHGNNQRTAFLPISMNILGNVKWVFDGNDSFDASLLVDNSTVYGATHFGTLYAIDKFTKQMKWSFYASHSINDIVMDNTTIYLGGSNNNIDINIVYALDKSKGTVKWSNEINNRGSFVVDEKYVYFGSNDKKIYALNKLTGLTEWVYLANNSIISGVPAIEDNTIYFTDYGNFESRLYALNKTTGQLKWSYLVSNVDYPAHSPAVSGNLVYTTSKDGKIYAIEKTTGQFKWSYTTNSGTLSTTPALDDNTLYFGDSHKKVYALDKITGQLKWSFETPGIVESGILVDNTRVYIGCFAQNIYVLNKLTGIKEKEIITGGLITNGLATDGKILYAAGFDDKIYAIE